MPHQKFRGFVLRVIPLGESDRLLSLLTAEHGLIKAYARGARRSKSPLRMATQDFVLSDFEVFLYKERFQIDGAELVEPFLQLQQDITRLICAAHLAQVVHDGAEHDAKDTDFYRFWAYTLHQLIGHEDPVLITHVGQMRILSQIGFMPHLDACVLCGRDLQAPYHFSIASCGLICTRFACQEKAWDVRPILAATKACLLHCQNERIERLFNFSLQDQARQEFITLARAYLEHQMEKPYNRLDMLNQVENLDSDPKNH